MAEVDVAGDTDRRDVGARRYPPGTGPGVVVRASGQVIRGRASCITRDEVEVQWTEPSAPVPVATAAVEVELGLAGGSIRVRGIVRRSEFESVAIELYEPTPSIRARIEEEVRAEADAVPQVLLVDPSGPRRSRLASLLREAGCAPLEAATPLEAIDLFESPHGEVVAVALAERLTQTGSGELADFLHDTHPGLKIALIAEGTGAREPSPAVDAVLFGDDNELSDPLIDLVHLYDREHARRSRPGRRTRGARPSGK